MELLDEVPWLKPYKSQPFFGSSAGSAVLPPKRKYVVRRIRETWLYRVVLEQGVKGGGRLRVFRFNMVSPEATATFLDRVEGDLMFEELWDKVREITDEAVVSLEGGN